MTDIAALRESKGLSQVDLARMANMDVRTLRRIEKGEGASEHMMERVLAALGRSLPVDGPDQAAIDRSLAIVGKECSCNDWGIVLAFVIPLYMMLSPVTGLFLMAVGEPVGLSDPAGQTMIAIYAFCILIVTIAARRTRKSEALARPAAFMVLDAISSGRVKVIDERVGKRLYHLAGRDAFHHACNAPHADFLIHER